MIDQLLIEGIEDVTLSNIAPLVTRLDLSWTMDAASQLTFDFTDPGFRVWNANYLQRRRVVLYKGRRFEIAARTLSQGQGASPRITVEARSAPVQAMKRDKNPEAYSGSTPTEYARTVASRFGLEFYGEPSAAKKIIMQASTDTKKESVWDTLTRLASEAKFVVFESDGTLYFTSQRNMVGKFDHVPILHWPNEEGDLYPLIEIPTCRDSEDSPTEKEFTATLFRHNAVNLRPGMTIALLGIPDFHDFYLISEVSYNEGDGKPVSISARTPEKIDA